MSDEPHATSSSDGSEESDETEPNTNGRQRSWREGTAPDRGDDATMLRGDDEPPPGPGDPDGGGSGGDPGPGDSGTDAVDPADCIDPADRTDPEDGDDPADRTDPEDGDDSADGDDETLEYRLERLRLWRTVVTLAVVIARLIRSV